MPTGYIAKISHRGQARREPPLCHPDREHEAFGLCRSCYRKQDRRTNGQKYHASEKRRYGRRKESLRDYQLQRFYGINSKEYSQLLERQFGLCAICRRVNGNARRLHVDHDHETGKVRGLLCGSCNAAIALFHEKPNLMLDAIRYLKGDSSFLRDI